MSIDIKISPENLVFWSNFEDWVDGTSSAPTGHVLTGASASVSREATTIKEGLYSCALTRSGADASIYHDFPDYLDYAGRKMTFAMWVHCGTGSRARISINDGIGSSNSSYHTGGGDWERLTVTRNIQVSTSQIRISCEVNTGDVTAYFDGGILVEGDSDLTVLSSIVDISKWKEDSRFRIQSNKVTRRTGSNTPNSIIEKKSISFDTSVIGTSPTNMRTNLDALMKAINSNTIKPNGDTEKKDLYLFDDRLYQGFVSSFSPDLKAASRINDIGLKFEIPDPFQRAIQKTRHKETISATPTTFTVTNGGNVPIHVIITITNNSSSVSSLRIDNLTSDQFISFAGTLATSQDLVIDTDIIEVTNNAVQDITNSDGDLDLVLMPGDNEIILTGIVSGVITLDWFDKWY